MNFEEFLKSNRIRVNRYLNKVLWIGSLVGVLLALGIWLQFYRSVSYESCFIISGIMVILATIHTIMMNRKPESRKTSYFALLVMDVLLVFMVKVNVGIRITWFVIPLLSLLFCDLRLYFLASVTNFVCMTASSVIISPVYARLRVDFDKPLQFFKSYYSGMVIEMMIMLIAGYALYKMMRVYFESVDEENKREEYLLQISLTDGLTGLSNRRCYEEDVSLYGKSCPEGDFVLFSMDINGLKTANDTMGHAAGDELIIAAADCILRTIGEKGKAYRVGGDEFAVIYHGNDYKEVWEALSNRISEWHGNYNQSLALAIGYAASKDYPGQTINELERHADQMMYSEKEHFYTLEGHDRRRKREK